MTPPNPCSDSFNPSPRRTWAARVVTAALCLAAALDTAIGPSWAVVINEIRIDQTGTDNSEYFELFGSPGESLAGLWYVVLGDVGSGTVEAVVELSGVIPANRYFLVAESTFENSPGAVFDGVVPNLVDSLNFENGDNVTHLLVRDFTGANGGDLDTNDDGFIDVMPWVDLLDAVGLIERVGPPVETGDEWSYGASLGYVDIGPDGTFVPSHVFRLPDGGAFQIGLFNPADVDADDTPGGPNSDELLGDMDGDSDVDFDDIDDFVLGLNNPAQYESNFGFPPSARGDTDMDGDMDFDDISGFVAILSGGARVATVPEPASASLLLAAACAVFGWHVRKRRRRAM